MRVVIDRSRYEKTWRKDAKLSHAMAGLIGPIGNWPLF